MLLETYDNIYVEFMRTFKLDGVDFKVDSGRLYDELKPLVIDGLGWAYVKPFGTKWDGRRSVLALKKQAESSAATK